MTEIEQLRKELAEAKALLVRKDLNAMKISKDGLAQLCSNWTFTGAQLHRTLVRGDAASKMIRDACIKDGKMLPLTKVACIKRKSDGEPYGEPWEVVYCGGEFEKDKHGDTVLKPNTGFCIGNPEHVAAFVAWLPTIK